MFDVDKLAWVNRHYLKAADADRLARLSLPYLQQARMVSERDRQPTSTFLDAGRPGCGSVRRSARAGACTVGVPVRLLRDARAGDPTVRAEAHGVAERSSTRLPRNCAQSSRCSIAEAFRAAATRVRERTGQKGKALFHPIRLALTGEAEGLELDLAVPAIERGARARRRPGSSSAILASARERALADVRVGA